ncbi:Protein DETOXIFICATION like [Actinidia chinensis var. chinensis]|uniref:Protein DETOXIFICATION n=1 Tax=Actinidia chinensis var. chinensis TaxID=1590841 RepID=A0A2R6PE92_ACTCC|nr:Protein DETOXIFICATION like [Actinidia chinensis var. chinensis]
MKESDQMDQEHLTNLLESPLCEKSNEEWCDVSKSTIVELKKQVHLAGPLVVVSLLQYSLQMISVMFIGHLGELSLSSASMATSFAGVTGFSLMMGMGSVLETLCGQDYGAKQYHMLGIHMQRAMLVLMLMGIPVALLWACTGYIFISCGQVPEISTQAGIYARWLILSIFPYGLLQCQTRFLQTQNNIWPLMTSTAITSLIHVLVCWCLVFGFGLGSRGAALSSAISYWTNVSILAIYIKFSPACEKTWMGFSKEGMRNIFGFLSLAVPSALMVCLEFWSYEFLVLMSGLLPNPKLETSMMSVSLNAISVVYRIPFGFASAVSTRVSNELGAGRPQAARLAVRVVILLAVAEGFLVGLLSIAVRDVWGYLYTNDKEVVKYFASIMPVLATSVFMDGIQGVLSGAARGCGRQKLGAFVNLGAYYLVGLPCAIILTFVFHFGGKGLWMGIIGGSGLQALLLLTITMRTDWEQQASKARHRVYASSIPSDTVL